MEEVKKVEIKPTLPLNLKKEMDLKLYAMAMVKKDLYEREQMYLIKDKLIISLVMAYSDAEAYMGCRGSIQNLGFDPDLYVIPSAFISKDVEEFMKSISFTPIMSTSTIVPLEVEKPVEEVRKKSVESIVASVRMVFDQYGNSSQKKMAEEVINKFLETNAKTGN